MTLTKSVVHTFQWCIYVARWDGPMPNPIHTEARQFHSKENSSTHGVAGMDVLGVSRGCSWRFQLRSQLRAAYLAADFLLQNLLHPQLMEFMYFIKKSYSKHTTDTHCAKFNSSVAMCEQYNWQVILCATEPRCSTIHPTCVTNDILTTSTRYHLCVYVGGMLQLYLPL